jgi:hypothetical protein
MKYRFVVCSVLLAALAIGCEARLEVAKERVKEQIDSLLGSMDVKRKDIDLSVSGLRDGINSLRKAKIRAKVSKEGIESQARPLEEKLVSLDAVLNILRGHLKASEPVEIAGKTCSHDDLNDLTDRILQARKIYVGQLTGFHEAKDRLEKVASTLERKQLDLQQHLAAIEGQLVVIDSNRTALVAMQKSAEAMGNDGSLSKSLDTLQAKVNVLYSDVEVELRTEDAKWADEGKEIDAVETNVAGFETPQDRIGEIDKILNDKR